MAVRICPGIPVAKFFSTVLAVIFCAGASSAWAQQFSPRIWDIPFGTHVRDLPVGEFVDPACGTNGGPPSLFITSFDRFQMCPEEAGGLREVWFIYDDALEYAALARRVIAPRTATAVLDQPVILSFLIDGDALVQGYRIFTDPRAGHDLRLEAYTVAIHFKARFGLEQGCGDLPKEEGENSIDGVYVKELCHEETDGRTITVESRYYYKPGQQRFDPRTNLPMDNEFESSARLEVLSIGPLPAAAAEDRAAAPAMAAASQPVPDQRETFLAGESVDCPGCDLAGADLRRRDLSDADLSGANLDGAILHRAILRRADLSGANLSGANLNRADLSFADLRGASLVAAMLFQTDAPRANFSGADLTGAMLGKARITLTIFDGANLDFSDLGEARLNDASLINATLNGAYMPQVILFRADLRGIVAEEAVLAEASLRGANLSGASFQRSDLFGADLGDANLSDANFSAARLLSANLGNTNQSGTIFAGAVMPDNTIHP